MYPNPYRTRGLPYTPVSYTHLKMSGQRDTLKERWNSALAVYDKMDIVDETEVKDKFVTSVVFWDAILTMILSGIL